MFKVSANLIYLHRFVLFISGFLPPAAFWLRSTITTSVGVFILWVRITLNGLLPFGGLVRRSSSSSSRGLGYPHWDMVSGCILTWKWRLTGMGEGLGLGCPCDYETGEKSERVREWFRVHAPRTLSIRT